MFKKEAEEICSKYFEENCYKKNKWADTHDLVAMWQDGYNKANEWQKIINWEDNSQFPKDELETYLVRLYQDHCVVCGLSITEGYRQFYLEDNNEYIDPQDVIAWKEIVLPELKESE